MGYLASILLNALDQGPVEDRLSRGFSAIPKVMFQNQKWAVPTDYRPNLRIERSYFDTNNGRREASPGAKREPRKALHRPGEILFVARPDS